MTARPDTHETEVVDPRAGLDPSGRGGAAEPAAPAEPAQPGPDPAEPAGHEESGSEGARERLGHAIEHAKEAVKPKLRGWLHFGAAPLALVLGLGLMVVTPTERLRGAVAIYVLTTVLLFGVSAAYHLGAGRPSVNAFLRKLDHANIYLFIAGSYTPFAAALPDQRLGATILALVWGIALVGLLLPIAWLHAPRWVTAGSYIALGWVALFYLPSFWTALGGVLYTIGGVVYARKRPNPHPGWFGFHEVFHAFTIAAYLVQYVAVAIVVTG
ncbi:MAG: hemolysin III family protein [Candidatus Nanopelagicales bacterium]|nr:hemolysin III family protein [Candidatus Nanopelagicales bacterium]